MPRSRLKRAKLLDQLHKTYLHEMVFWKIKKATKRGASKQRAIEQIEKLQIKLN